MAGIYVFALFMTNIIKQCIFNDRVAHAPVHWTKVNWWCCTDDYDRFRSKWFFNSSLTNIICLTQIQTSSHKLIRHEMNPRDDIYHRSWPARFHFYLCVVILNGVITDRSIDVICAFVWMLARNLIHLKFDREQDYLWQIFTIQRLQVAQKVQVASTNNGSWFFKCLNNIFKPVDLRAFLYKVLYKFI